MLITAAGLLGEQPLVDRTAANSSVTLGKELTPRILPWQDALEWRHCKSDAASRI